MARQRLMYWVESRKGWLKEYRGKTYAVSCRQLGKPANKTASEGAANAWWELKQAEIDARIDPEREALQKHREDLLRQIRELDTEISKTILEGGDNPANFHLTQYAVSVTEQIDAYLKWNIQKANSSEISISGYDAIRCRVQNFHKFLTAKHGANVSVDVFTNGAALRAYEQSLMETIGTKGNKRDTQHCRLRTAKSFIRWLASSGVIELPSYLFLRGQFSIGTKTPKIKTWKTETIRQLFASSLADRTRLYFLLMLNCGMYSGDIADIEREEIDLEKGTITRKRSKTQDESDTPLVQYKLWQQTLDLLRQEMATVGDLALLNEDGKPLRHESIKASGKMTRTNNVTTACVRVLGKLKISETPKTLRHTSASLLAEHPEYAKYAQYFLAQSPRTIADKHYVKPHQQAFDSAIRWLGEQLGIR